VEEERPIKSPPFLYVCKLANFQGSSHESYSSWGRIFKFMKLVEMTTADAETGEQVAPRSVGMRSNIRR
jgi:hypothetical protein